jgi:hypothetical protein
MRRRVYRRDVGERGFQRTIPSRFSKPLEFCRTTKPSNFLLSGEGVGWAKLRDMQAADAEAAILLQEENIGWVAPPEHPKALAQIISSAASAAADTKEKGHRAAIVASRYTRQIALDAYRDLMDMLLERQLARTRVGSKSVA